MKSVRNGVLWLLLAIAAGCTEASDHVGDVWVAEAEPTDADEDGYVAAEDCDDTNAAIHPDAEEVCDGVDNNCIDGIDEGFDEDEDSVTSCNGDCDDSDPDTFINAPELCDGKDNDCDGAPEVGETDEDGDEQAICDGDCNDEDPTVFNGAPEQCDGQANDCDDNVSQPEVPQNELDEDEDGFFACAECDDTDDEVNPGEEEVCDGKDNDCDGETPSDESDVDEDGFLICENDCDDTDNTINPSADDSVCDGIDTDCSDQEGNTDANDEVDNDLDGFRNCEECDDNSSDTFPGAIELCDGQDNDCNGVVPADELDLDADTFAVCDGDCNEDLVDTNGDGIIDGPTIYPGAPEVCDGLDNDCDLQPEIGSEDDDTDGQSICGGDCNDSDDTVYDGAPELCDGQGNDCAGNTVQPPAPAPELDDDLDGYVECTWVGSNLLILGGDDCDDVEATVFPTAPELCDGIANDCLSAMYPIVDPNETDDDLDTYAECAGDCDDTNVLIFPGATELCNGVDDDCDSSVPANEQDDDGDQYVECDPWVGSNPAVLAGNDCDDNDNNNFPGNTEDCDGADNDCNGTPLASELDLDGDLQVSCSGWTGVSSLSSGDCDDNEITVFTGAPELCDLLANDCANAAWPTLPDAEDDDDGDTKVDCDLDNSGIGDDCDDTVLTTYEGASELCNGVDDSCDGSVPANEQDGDLDNQVSCIGWSGSSALASGDCDDTNPATFTGASEVCDQLDNDCDTVVPADEADDDGDQYVECDPWVGSNPSVTAGNDCNDTPVTGVAINPGATELCDGLDNDCDGSAEAGDVDGDGQAVCGGDCDETDITVYDGAPELCDGVANDCMGQPTAPPVPVTETDDDGDGYVECGPPYVGTNPAIVDGGDCLDDLITDVDGDGAPDGPVVSPAATETLEAFDWDCDQDPYNGTSLTLSVATTTGLNLLGYPEVNLGDPSIPSCSPGAWGIENSVSGAPAATASPFIGSLPDLSGIFCALDLIGGGSVPEDECIQVTFSTTPGANYVATGVMRFTGVTEGSGICMYQNAAVPAQQIGTCQSGLASLAQGREVGTFVGTGTDTLIVCSGDSSSGLTVIQPGVYEY